MKTNDKLQIISEDEINLRVLAQVLWRGRKLILYITGAITVLSVVCALLLTPLFMATITLYPSTQTGSSGLGQLQGIAASFGFNMGRAETAFHIPDIVESRRLHTMIMYNRWHSTEFTEPLDLVTYWEINDTTGFSLNPREWIRALLTPGGKKRDLTAKWEDRGLRKLAKRISVKETRSGLVRVGVWMEEPRMAADIANYIYDAIVDYTVNVHNLQARLNREFIEKRRKEVKSELTHAEDVLKEFRDRNRRVSDSPELQLELERLMREVRIQTEVYITLQQQYELARIEEVKKTPSVVFLDEAQPPVKKDKPRRKKLVIMAMLLGLFVSPLAVVTRHILNQRSNRRQNKTSTNTVTNQLGR